MRRRFAFLGRRKVDPAERRPRGGAVRPGGAHSGGLIGPPPPGPHGVESRCSRSALAAGAFGRKTAAQNNRRPLAAQRVDEAGQDGPLDNNADLAADRIDPQIGRCSSRRCIPPCSGPGPSTPSAKLETNQLLPAVELPHAGGAGEPTSPPTFERPVLSQSLPWFGTNYKASAGR